MQDKQKELFQSHIERLRGKNDDLKDKLAFVKKENIDILKSLTRSESLLNSMPAGLILIQDRKVLRANDASLEYLGYKPEDIIGIDFTDLIHADERDHIAQIHKVWESGRMSPDQYEARLIPSSGMPVFYEIRCSRIRFQNRTAFLLIVTNIKERREQEKEKIRREKTDALLTMAVGVKDKLGPFTDIILEAIRECKTFDHFGNKRLDGIFKRLEEASVKALKVNEELEIIAGTGKDRPVPIIFSLNEAVKAAVQSVDRTYGEQAETRGIKTAFKSYLRSSSFIEGDLKKITDAISNIITNAMEAMPEGGDIYITTEDNNDDSHVYVQDSGKGIPDTFKDRIFDPFFTSKKGSLGLGLSMSCSIVEKHGGNIEFTSRDGEGAIFHIRLPIARQKPVSKTGGFRKKITDARIMIIQENDVAREILSHTLKTKGCRIFKAVNAIEGLVKLRNRPFDMLIVDDAALNMGRDVFIKKARKVVPGLPIALILDSKAKSEIDNNQGMKADLNIIKPIDINSALKQISAVLSVKKA
jgi:PAS domain S-box-containing protein